MNDIIKMALESAIRTYEASSPGVMTVEREQAVEALRVLQLGEKVKSTQTTGMSLGERIQHVGGRENAQGYVEFGSVMAVKALIDHVLRDVEPTHQPMLAPPSHDQYYLQNGFIGNTASFWRRKGAGYTADLNDAEVFTKDEAFRQHASREDDVPVLKSLADELARPSVNFDNLRRALLSAKQRAQK